MFSPVSPTFSHHLLNNPPGLNTFMSGQKSISEIEKLSKNPKFTKTQSDDIPYFGHWQVAWISVKHPFEAIFSVFLSATSYLLNALYFCKSARIVSVLSRQMTRDWDQLSDHWRQRKPMLAPAFNAHQTRSWDVYQYGSIPIEHVKNDLIYDLTFQSGVFRKNVKEAIKIFYTQLELSRKGQGWINWARHLPETLSDRGKKKTTQKFSGLYKKNPSAALEFLKKKYPSDHLDIPLHKLYHYLKRMDANLDNQKDLNLFSPRGVCRGDSLWFVYLYLKTQHLFKIPGQHARAVATQFKSGAPSQAALFQALNRPEVLLDIKKIKQKDHKISLYELDFNKESAHDKIRTLSEGVYRVGVYHHSIAYIKISDTKGYVWDPNYGLFPMNGEEMLQMVREHHYKSGDPDSYLYFEKYENLQPQSI